jgi:hypothetical protein
VTGRTGYRASTEVSDKPKAKDIEAKERSRILEARHGIQRQPDITFAEFAKTYMKDHAELNKRSSERDRYILKVLNKAFGTVILHQITAHWIEQFKRERLAGKWRGHNTKHAGKPIRPASVNRELDTLKSIFSKAVEWGKLFESPARNVKRLKVENRRTRILTDAEQTAILEACRRKMRAIANPGPDFGRAHRRDPGAALGALPRRLRDVLGDKERAGTAHPYQSGNRGCSIGRAGTRTPVGIHEQQNRAAVSERAKSLRPGRATRGHHDWRRYAAHVATHGTQPNDRERVRRLHRDGDQRALLDTDARAVHPSSRRPEGCGARLAGRGHKLVTNGKGRSIDCRKNR